MNDALTGTRAFSPGLSEDTPTNSHILVSAFDLSPGFQGTWEVGLRLRS